MVPNHPEHDPEDDRNDNDVEQPTNSTSEDESPAGDQGAMDDIATADTAAEFVAPGEPEAAPFDELPPIQALDEPAADASLAPFTDSDQDLENVDVSDAIDGSLPPDAQPTPATEFEPIGATGDSNSVAGDFTAANDVPDSAGAPVETDNGADESIQAMTPEILKPAEEWPWGNPLAPFRSWQAESELDAGDAAGSRTPDPESEFEVPDSDDPTFAPANDLDVPTLDDRAGESAELPRVEFVAPLIGRRSEAKHDFDSPFESSPPDNPLLEPTSDGGPPLARPTVLVSLQPDEMRRVIEDTLEAASQRDAQTTAEIAEFTVNDRFWLRECQLRAIYGS